MSRLLSALVVCLLTAIPALAGFSSSQDFRPATPEETALKDVSFAPGASAVILDWVEIDEDQHSISSEYYRIKILSEEGRKYADVEVPYLAGYPFHGRVTEISARTIQPDGRIVPFNGKVYDKIMMKAGGVRLRAKTFSLPDVQPGSILEYRYQRRWSPNLLMNTTWVIQRDIPVMRASMTLKPYDSRGEYRSYFTYFRLPEGKKPVAVGKSYALEVTNVVPYQAEPFSPPEDWLKMRVNFYYTADRTDLSKFWSVQLADWNKSIESYIGKPGAVQSAAQPLIGKTPAETAQNLYARVQTFRNLSFEEESDADPKKNAAAVVEASEGYRSEINRAFVALARAAGLEASVVRVAPRDRFFFSPNIADAEQMAGEIAVVMIGSQSVYVDPGTPGAPFGVVSWEKSNVPGLRVAKGAMPLFNTVAISEAGDAVMRRNADLRLAGDVLEGRVTVTFTGQEALQRRLRTWGEDDATRAKDLEDEARGWFPDGATVKMTAISGEKSHAEPLVVKYDVTLPGLVSEAGSRTVLPISVFAASAKNPLASAARTHEIYYHYPHSVEDDVRVTLPETVSLADLPQPAQLNGGVLQYTNQVKRDGNAIQFQRRMSVNAMLIGQEYYGALRKFYSAMVTADQVPLVLVAR